MDLQQRYGCVAGVPGGAFAGQRSISRFEAAALLLACLDRVEALPDGLRVGPGANDGSYVWEAWYRLQISDQISVTPAIFYLSAPLGQLQKGGGRSFDNLGALIKTSFRF
jgi:hypothetical protein